MDLSSKNRLQEYCMKKKFGYPNYRIIQQVGPEHAPKFQVEVEVNGKWYTSDDFYLSKKQAEQSAARRALEMIEQTDDKSVSEASAAIAHITLDDLDPPPSYSEVTKSIPIEHLPFEYKHIEEYISIMVKSFRGRVRKIWASNSDGLFKFEVTGAYRYCDNIQEQHKKPTIYFMVDPINSIYYQMCHHPQCSGFRSVARRITIRSEACANVEKVSNV